MNTLKRIEARLSETAGPAVRTAKVLTKLAPLLVQNGFKVSKLQTTTGAKVPTAYEGNMSASDTMALLKPLGLIRDKKQFKGHYNFTTSDGELVQVQITSPSVTTVTTQPGVQRFK